jgi:hypothetical protein
MQKLTRASLFALACFAAACSNNNKGGDGGVDGGLMDAAAPDMTFVPSVSGTNILPGHTNSVLATTTDDFAIVRTSATGSTFPISVVPLAGGSAQSVATGIAAVDTINKTAFAWTSAGALTVWTSAGGAHAVEPNSTPLVDGVTDDGSRILYASNAANGTTMDISVANPDGTVAHPSGAPNPLTGVANDLQNCPPQVNFAASKFWITTCATTNTDMGPIAATLSTVDPTTGATTQIATDLVNFFSLNTAGTKAFVVDLNSNGIIYQPGAATITIPEPVGAVLGGFMLKDGSAVIYNTMSGALKKATLTATTATISTLIASGAGLLVAVSPDQNSLLVGNTFDTMTGTSDLSLITLSGTPASTQLVASGGITFGSRFTIDSSWALYYNNLQADQSATLLASPVAGGAMKTISTSTWDDFAVSGTKIIYNDNFKSMGMTGRADGNVLDVAGAAGPTLIVTQAELDFQLSKSKKYAVFTYIIEAGKEGVYAYSVQ